eukprot:7386542-Prymnesium_polylepis.2
MRAKKVILEVRGLLHVPLPGSWRRVETASHRMNVGMSERQSASCASKPNCAKKLPSAHEVGPLPISSHPSASQVDEPHISRDVPGLKTRSVCLD